MDKKRIVRTRMAPSPTGELHIGTLRTALYSWAYAKKNSGKFILRIEDTDQERLVEGATERIMKDLTDCGIDWNEGPVVGGPNGPYIQTERLDIYHKYIDKLLDEGKAYYCFCTKERLEEMRESQKKAGKVPKYDRRCLNLSKDEIKKRVDSGEKYVIRLKIPDDQVIIFDDAIRGEIKINSNDVDDQVLIKSNGIPTYHFAVVIDDHLMEITHIFRGEEWISSTPKQIVLYNYFGWEIPIFAHLTVLLDPSHSGKMSKRRGSVFVRQFLDEGYLPEALVNFLMLLGWNPGTDQEIFSLDEFVDKFSLDKLHKKAPVFDKKKLNYFNGVYIRKLSDNDLSDRLIPHFSKAFGEIDVEKVKQLTPLIKERINTLGEATGLCEYVFSNVNYGKTLLEGKNADRAMVVKMLSGAVEFFEKADFGDMKKMQSELLKMVDDNAWHRGAFFMALRVSIAGKAITPPIVETLHIIGKERTLERLKRALE